ncbi:copper-binding protein [Lichenibacterium minor]|uniref:Copper-binding protein n=1 Tax=Lichenibacterium minor TaxID=2316528 RepID=A0A4Q2U8N3_9HYPH|nr:copper-binding protein [Lichenibacterium minor]RYC31336.1 copper-binding protein [Lichenibacterium minor]
MNRISTTLVALAAVLGFAGAALAATVNGDVQKVDAATGKVTLKHGPIPALDMGDMTMVYTAKDPAMLKGLKAGDKVRFDPAEVDSKYVVTKIERAK